MENYLRGNTSTFTTVNGYRRKPCLRKRSPSRRQAQPAAFLVRRSDAAAGRNAAAPMRPRPDKPPPDPKETTKKSPRAGQEAVRGANRAEKKHTKAVQAAKTPAEKATVSAANAEEVAALDAEQDKEWSEADPNGVAPSTYNGLDLQEAVAALHAELSDMAAENNIEVSDLRNFGLEFDVFDPVTGMVISPARAHRRDVGDAGQLMTADAVISDIISARQHQKTAGVTQYSADRTAVA